MDSTINEKLQSFERLLTVMKELRAKCPWDKKQTFESLRANTIEETYELSEAILGHDMQEIKKELGDLLLHIVFYAEIASETNDFDIKNVCDTLCDKLIFRHPHVFGTTEAENSQIVEQNWEKLKLKEKDGNKTVLSGVPTSLPSLIKAYRMQDKARSVGFDWEQREQVWDKVQEELLELKTEITNADQDKMESEFGDFIFSIVNAARLYNVNPDTALERTNEKFRRRFNFLESKTISQGKSLHDMTLAEMDIIWEEAKKEERK